MPSLLIIELKKDDPDAAQKVSALLQAQSLIQKSVDAASTGKVNDANEASKQKDAIDKAVNDAMTRAGIQIQTP